MRPIHSLKERERKPTHHFFLPDFSISTSYAESYSGRLLATATKTKLELSSPQVTLVVKSLIKSRWVNESCIWRESKPPVPLKKMDGRRDKGQRTGGMEEGRKGKQKSEEQRGWKRRWEESIRKRERKKRRNEKSYQGRGKKRKGKRKF